MSRMDAGQVTLLERFDEVEADRPVSLLERFDELERESPGAGLDSAMRATPDGPSLAPVAQDAEPTGRTGPGFMGRVGAGMVRAALNKPAQGMDAVAAVATLARHAHPGAAAIAQVAREGGDLARFGAEGARRMLGTAPNQGTLADALGEGAVDLAHAAAAAPLAAVAAPVAVAGFAGLSGAQAVGSTFRQAVDETGNADAAALEATLNGTLTAATSALPGMAILNRIPGGGALVRKATATVVGRIGTAAAAEGGMNVVQGVGAEVLAELIRRDGSLSFEDAERILTDPARAVEAVSGGLLGGVARGVHEAPAVARGGLRGSRAAPDGPLVLRRPSEAGNGLPVDDGYTNAFGGRTDDAPPLADRGIVVTEPAKAGDQAEVAGGLAEQAGGVVGHESGGVGGDVAKRGVAEEVPSSPLERGLASEQPPLRASESEDAGVASVHAETPGRAEDPTASTGARVLGVLDRLEAEAAARLKKRQSERGVRLYSGVDPELLKDLGDYAVIAGVRVAKAGVKGAGAIRDAARKAVDEIAPHLDDARRAVVAKMAARVVRGAADETGGLDADELGRGLSALVRSTEPSAVPDVDKLRVAMPARAQGYDAGRKDGRTEGNLRVQATRDADAARLESAKVKVGMQERAKADRRVEAERTRGEKAAEGAYAQAVRETRLAERFDARKRLEQMRLRTGITERARGYDQGRRDGRAEGDLRVEAVKQEGEATLASEKTKVGMQQREAGRIEGRKLEQADRQAVHEIIRRQVPKRLRGEFMTELRKTKKNPEGFAQIRDKVEKVLAADHGRRMMRDLKKLGSDKKLRTLTEAERAEVHKLLAEADQRFGSIETHIGAADDLTRIADEARGVYATNRNNRKLRIGREYVDREAIVDAGAKAIEAGGKQIRGRRGLAEDPKGSGARRLHQSFLTMDTIARRMGDEQLHRLIVGDMRDAETATYADTQRAEDALLSSLERHGYKPGSDRAQRMSRPVSGDKVDVLTVKLDSGQTLELSPGEAMTLYAMSGDRDARANIERGTAITFSRNKSTGKPVELSPFDLRRITDSLTPEQRAIVDDIKKYVDDQIRPGVFESHRDLRGFDLEAVPGYWRTRRNMAQADTIGRDTVLSMGEVVRKELQNLGFLKERTGGKTPYLINDFFEDFSEIAHTSALVTHMARPIRNAELVFWDPRMHRAIAGRFGVGMNRRIQDHINAAKVLYRDPQSGVEKVASWGARNIARAKLAANPKTWIKQVGGVAKALGEFSREEAAAGLKALGDPSIRRDMLASPYFRQRYDTSIYRRASPSLGERRPLLGSSSVRELLGQVRERPLGVVGELVDKIPAMNFMDSLSAQAAWGAAQAKGQSRGLAGDELKAFTAREAERAIRNTANTSSPLDMSDWSLTTRGKATSLFLQFTSDSNKSYNLITQAIDERDIGKLAGVATNTVIGAAVTVAFATLWALGDSPEEKAKAPGLLAKARTALVGELAGIPYFGGDAAKLAGGIVDLVRGEQAGRVADLMPDTAVGSAGVRVLDGVFSLAKAIGSYLNDEGDDRRFASGPRKGQDKVLANLADAAENAIGGGTELFAGVPVLGVLRDFKAIANLIRGESDADAALTEFYRARNAAEDKSPERRRLDRFADRIGELRKAASAGAMSDEDADERILAIVRSALGSDVGNENVARK